jgi:hypothetical protein
MPGHFEEAVRIFDENCRRFPRPSNQAIRELDGRLARLSPEHFGAECQFRLQQAIATILELVPPVLAAGQRSADATGRPRSERIAILASLLASAEALRDRGLPLPTLEAKGPRKTRDGGARAATLRRVATCVRKTLREAGWLDVAFQGAANPAVKITAELARVYCPGLNPTAAGLAQEFRRNPLQIQKPE